MRKEDRATAPPPTGAESAPPAEPADAAAPGARRWNAARILALVALPILCLWGSLGNAYHLDDAYRIQGNIEVERVHPVWRHFTDPMTSTSLPTLAQYRPLLPLTLSLSAWAGDRLEVERVVAHRAGNLGVHVLTGLLVFGLLAELLRHAPARVRARRRELAFAGALLFALHPVAGVPVQYLCARDLGLANLFLVAATWSYARMRRVAGDSVVGWGATLLLATLSILAKTNAAAFFGLVLAYELTLAGGRLASARLWGRVALAGSVTLAFFAWTRYLDFSDADSLLVDDRTPLAYGLTELRVHLCYYLRNAFVPLYLRPLPAIDAAGLDDPGVLLGGALVVGSLVLAWRARRARPELAFAVFAYWVLFSLTSSAIPLRSFAADYRQVPSLVYLMLLLAGGVLAALPPRAALALTLVAAAALGVQSQRQGVVWETERSLWGDAVRKGTTGRGHMNYAMAIAQEDPLLAEEHYQIALRENPYDVFARINLGLLRIRRGRTADGMAEVETAARQSPDWPVVQHWLAYAHRQLGARERAARASSRAAELDPSNPEYLYWAGYDRQALGDHAAALPLFTALGERAGAWSDSRFRTAWAWQETGRPDKAIPLYEAHLAARPDDYQAWFNLALARKNRADFGRAVDGFERALELQPRYAECHFHLADCLERLGRAEEAEAHRAAYAAAQRERGLR